MKIAHLIAGAGPMYCGSCMHGNTLAAALRKAGADVVLAPVYTPLRTDEENVSIDRLAMGGINVYLDEGLPFWRWMPRFLRRQLDRPALVSWVARRGSSTRPEQLGRLAVAMFRGEDGPLKGDVQGLVEWLQVRGPARCCSSLERHARWTCPSASPAPRCAGSRHAFRRGQLSGKASRPVSRPGPDGPASLRGRPVGAGGHVRLLRRFHGRLSVHSARKNRRDTAGLELGRVWGSGCSGQAGRPHHAAKTIGFLSRICA